MAAFVFPSFGNATAPAAADCVRAQILSRIERAASRPKIYEDRVKVLLRACKEQTLALCRDGSLTVYGKQLLIRAAANLDDAQLREAFLQAFPAKSKDNLSRLFEYASRRLKFCNPPIHESCASERWQMVFEDYLARTGDFPEARFLRRWSDDRLAERIPGLEGFITESPNFRESVEKARAYQGILDTPGLTADSISIMSEQSMKKPLNDINKGLSDALGSARLRMFRWHLEKILSAQGLGLPAASRVDFKTDRMIEPVLRFRNDHPRRFEQAVNDAARLADAEFAQMIDTRFPELIYVTGLHDPTQWFNTASFSLPGFTPRLNEALASFKARKMRSGPMLTNEQARDEFVSLAESVIRSADMLASLDQASHGRLSSAGVLEPNGTFSRKTAELLRKMPSGSSLAQTVDGVFHGAKLTKLEEQLILQQWKAQDQLSIPLHTVDQMGTVPKGMAILGGDGVGGGAIDAWSKATALMDHRATILAGSTPNARANHVFDALLEADGNASQMIRMAPTLLQRAVERMPASIHQGVGLEGVMVSADDALVPLKRLMMLKRPERDEFYQRLTRRLSEQSQRLSLKRNGKSENVTVGPELLRAFLGFDKESAEAAETFLKPFEERLSRADILGPHWRAKYPNVAFLAVREDDQRFRLFIAGKSLDASLKSKLTEGLRAVSDLENVDLYFVERGWN